MNPATLIHTVEGTGSRAALESAADAIRQLRAWCDAQEIRILHELESLTFGAPETIAAAGAARVLYPRRRADRRRRAFDT